jgi:nucleoside-diphosphate-sugar epimerase
MTASSVSSSETVGCQPIAARILSMLGRRRCMSSKPFSYASSHVIPALIKKCLEARAGGEAEIVVWGDGSPTREFLYVEDAAEGIVLAGERYDGHEPVNLGSAFEISIQDLVGTIAGLTGVRDNLIQAHPGGF